MRKKRKIRLTESEMVNLIGKIIGVVKNEKRKEIMESRKKRNIMGPKRKSNNKIRRRR
jgi:hypothetical protein